MRWLYRTFRRTFHRPTPVTELTPLQRGLVASAERMTVDAEIHPGAVTLMPKHWRPDYAVRNGSPLVHVEDNRGGQ